jgi:membrane protein DedA with SNARE-associated domain
LDYFATYGLIAVFVSLITTPIGNPIPEDISLLGGGMLAGQGEVSVWLALMVGYVGVIIGDCIAWAMGRRVGIKPGGFLSKAVGNKQVARLQRFYERFGDRTILICRQLPGFRLPCFFIAGASGINIKRFLLIDGSAALVTTNVFVWLGYYYSDNLVSVMNGLQRFRQGISVLAVMAALMIVYRIVIYQMERHQLENKK